MREEVGYTEDAFKSKRLGLLGKTPKYKLVMTYVGQRRLWFNICLDCFWFYYYHHYEQNTRKVNRFLKVNCYPRCINFVVTMVT